MSTTLIARRAALQRPRELILQPAHMFIIWQGRGPIALVALTIPMALTTIGLFVSLKIEGISRSAMAALRA